MSPTPLSIEIRQGPTAQTPTKDLEASFARRSMMLVRRLLGEDGLISLLRDETTASTTYWKQIAASSHNQWKPSRIVLSPRGLTAKDFVSWFLPAQGGMLPNQEKLAAHPEHWVVRPATQPRTMTVLETLGEKPTLFELTFGVERPGFVQDNADFPIKMTGRGFIDGGVQIMELYHQFREHEDGMGFDVDLAIYFPEACEEAVVECHRQHLLVEFSNWLGQAYQASVSV